MAKAVPVGVMGCMYCGGICWTLSVTGDIPGICTGDCQLFIDAAGDWPGELSSLMDCEAELCVVMGVPDTWSIVDVGIFLRCIKCFSSISRRLFRVNGFGKTSSIPAHQLLVKLAIGMIAVGKKIKHTMLEIQFNVILANV